MLLVYQALGKLTSLHTGLFITGWIYKHLSISLGYLYIRLSIYHAQEKLTPRDLPQLRLLIHMDLIIDNQTPKSRYHWYRAGLAHHIRLGCWNSYTSGPFILKDPSEWMFLPPADMGLALCVAVFHGCIGLSFFLYQLKITKSSFGTRF